MDRVPPINFGVAFSDKLQADEVCSDEDWKVVDKRSSQLREDDVITLVDELASAESKLSLLDLGCNGLWPAACDSVSKFILAPGCGVRELHLDGNHLGDEGMRMLAEAMKDNTITTLLSVEHNAIGDEGCEVLSAALVTNRTLTDLSIAHNQFGDLGARAIANMLGGLGLNVTGEPWPSFEDEDEDDAKKKGAKKGKEADDSETERLAKEAKDQLKQLVERRQAVASLNNQSLVQLNISANNITHHGLEAVCKAITSHSALLELKCGENFADGTVMDQAAREQAVQNISDSVAANVNLRASFVKVAFIMGLHKRVGSRSPVRLLALDDVKPAILAPIWEFVGPV